MEVHNRFRKGDGEGQKLRCEQLVSVNHFPVSIAANCKALLLHSGVNHLQQLEDAGLPTPAVNQIEVSHPLLARIHSYWY